MEQIKSQTIQKDTSNDIVSLFKTEFNSTIIPVYIKSLDKELNFREVSVKEYKTFAKAAIDNVNKPATIYRALSALIETVMLSKDIDFGALTELDRVHILFNLCQTIILNQVYEATCPVCKNTYQFQPDFSKINSEFNNIDLTDKVYTIEDANRLYIFTVNFPTIRRLMDTLDYFQKHNPGKITENDLSVNANTIEMAMAYVHAYIKSITIENKGKSGTITANLDSLSADKVEEIIECLPQSIFNSSSEEGLVSKINNDFVDKANSVFQKEKCPSCGAEFPGIIGSISDFLFS